MDLDLHRPETYVDGPPHELFTRLRREQPVVWQDMDGEPGYWAVLRHADVVHVAKHPEIFSASLGGVVLEDLEPASLEQMRDMLLAMDPPRHTAYRRPIAPEFKARVIGGMEDRIRTITREILDRADAIGPEVEFVHDVCAHLPSQVVGELMGIPREDWADIHAMAERNSGGQDPDIADAADRGNSSVDMAMYGIGFAATRREMPEQGDLTDLLLGGEFDGKQMTDIDFGRFFVQLVTAGNDTTRTMLSGGLLALLQHPEQLQMLRDDRTLIPSAVEEILRWANPLHYFRRTATTDTELGGASIAAGDKVAMMYTSANRDEDVFEDPQRFDITRSPNHHLSFGIATHFCLGVHLARLEGRVFFEEVLARWPTIELTGEPRRQQSNLNNSLKSLPVRLT
ncbi:MAG: cytochrome P450 [Acidimicrobiales bacterium]|nr:cytochrome P450 [Acidimicrobiales bacterium]